MRLKSSLDWLIRTFIREYCRRSPIPRGKDRLQAMAALALSPYKGEATLLNGFKFVADLSDIVHARMYFGGAYEVDVTRTVVNNLRPGDTFIDIGANIGYYTYLAGSIVGHHGAVHSFEPIPEIFSLLETNLKLNSLTNVWLNQSAVFDEEGVLEIFLPRSNNMGGGSFLNSSTKPEFSIRSRSIQLDEYIKQTGIKKVRLIKVDIEGGELPALRGMQAILSSSSPPDLICEVHNGWLRTAGYTREDLVDFLESFGYRCSQIRSDGLGELDEYHVRPANLFFTYPTCPDL